MTRRELLARTAKLAPAVATVALLQESSLFADDKPERKGKVVVAGGHPGDPECGCAGTIARYTDLGYEVVVLYLNRGEGFCSRTDLKDCGRIRTAEAEKACAILNARPAFLTQYDGKAIVDAAHYDEFRNFVDTEKPDVVLAQWPIDAHRDHRAISLLALDAWLHSNKRFALYYYEVAEDTLLFSPTEYVDISAVESRRHAACYAHASQAPDKWFPLQTEITRYRALQVGNAWTQAEAFVRVSATASANPAAKLP